MKNAAVDAWFSTYTNPMKPVVARVRAIVLGADRRIEECIKWQAPTFVYRGNMASFFPRSRGHASLMFHEGARIPGKHPRLEGGSDKGRVMKLATVAEANAAKKDIERIVTAWCDWRDATVAGEGRSKKKATTKPASGLDEKTLARLRSFFEGRANVVEKRMIGGLCFMVGGAMCCGLTRDGLAVRVGPDALEENLRRSHTRPMTFGGRPLKAVVLVAPAGYRTPSALAAWVRRGLAFVTD